MVLSEHYTIPAHIVVSISVASYIAIRGYRHKSLSLDGAIVGWIVGFIAMLASKRMGLVLIAFFISSSSLTKRGAKLKRKIDAQYKEGGYRNYVQVLANGGVGTVLALMYLWTHGLSSSDRPVNFQSDPFGWFVCRKHTFQHGTRATQQGSFLLCAYIAHYACTNGDTWSSEIGVLSRQPPRLITTFKVVPAGTNGGISLNGTLAAAGGGLLIGTVFFVLGLFVVDSSYKTAGSEVAYVLVATAAGLLGSLCDSFLGATLQYSGLDSQTQRVVETPSTSTTHISGRPLLDNHGVNFLSALITSVVVGSVCYWSSK